MSRLKRLLPIHPGEILSEEFLEPLGMSMNKLADELHVPPIASHRSWRAAAA